MNRIRGAHLILPRLRGTCLRRRRRGEVTSPFPPSVARRFAPLDTSPASGGGSGIARAAAALAIVACGFLASCAVYPVGQDADGLNLRRGANRVMMALQDWHRAKGTYPGTLNDLVPQYLPAIPEQPVLHYRPADGSLAFRYIPTWPQLRPVWCTSVGNTTNWVCAEHLLFS